MLVDRLISLIKRSTGMFISRTADIAKRAVMDSVVVVLRWRYNRSMTRPRRKSSDIVWRDAVDLAAMPVVRKMLTD